MTCTKSHGRTRTGVIAGLNLRLAAANEPACSVRDDRSSGDCSGFVGTADAAAELEDSDFDDRGDAGFDHTDNA